MEVKLLFELERQSLVLGSSAEPGSIFDGSAYLFRCFSPLYGFSRLDHILHTSCNHFLHFCISFS
jgi:hypothetical protein